MNRNRKLRKQMMSGLAVGMAAVMGAAPVYAATGEDAAVSKEETVYVNANADGSEDQITVSNWLKNAGTEKNLQDESELKDIKNVKGDEEFTQSGNKLTWQTDGEDIYYQGTTTKEPPVSVKFTYYLDGKEIKPDDLAGKSGKLKITSEYEDIHSFVEANLIDRIGDAGKKLHTGRSRNDQVALDMKLYVRDEITEIDALVKEVLVTLEKIMEENIHTYMPGFTHLQKAQPITLAHHMGAYFEMFRRDRAALQTSTRE